MRARATARSTNAANSAGCDRCAPWWAPANTTTDELGPKPGGCNGYFVWEPGIYAQGPNALWRIWIVDVNGVRVVVRADSFPGTAPQVQAQLAAIVDSIQIEP